MTIGPLAYIGTQEILIVAGVIVLIFGGAKIPQLARGMGEAIREFRKSVDGVNGGDTAPDTGSTTNKPAA